MSQACASVSRSRGSCTEVQAGSCTTGDLVDTKEADGHEMHFYGRQPTKEPELPTIVTKDSA